VPLYFTNCCCAILFFIVSLRRFPSHGTSRVESCDRRRIRRHRVYLSRLCCRHRRSPLLQRCHLAVSSLLRKRFTSFTSNMTTNDLSALRALQRHDGGRADAAMRVRLHVCACVACVFSCCSDCTCACHVRSIHPSSPHRSLQSSIRPTPIQHKVKHQSVSNASNAQVTRVTI